MQKPTNPNNFPAAPEPLELKPDWPEAAARWSCFWKGQVSDRILTTFITVDPDKSAPPTATLDPETEWRDVEAFVERDIRNLERKLFQGDSVPYVFPNLGSVVSSLSFNTKVQLQTGMTWQHPAITEAGEMATLEPDYNNQWIELVREQCALFVERGSGRFLTGVPDFAGVSDALAAVRGSQELSIDLYDNAELVQQGAKVCYDNWIKLYDEFREMVRPTQFGTACFPDCWAPGEIECLQEDFADLVGVAHYRTYFQKWDQQIIERMDHTIFHLHNTMMFMHEAVLELKGLGAVQFRPPYTSHPNFESHVHHLEALNKLHEAGIGTQLWCEEGDDEIKTIIMNSDPRHLWLYPLYIRAAKAAEELLHKIEKWTAERCRQLRIKQVDPVI